MRGGIDTADNVEASSVAGRTAVGGVYVVSEGTAEGN